MRRFIALILTVALLFTFYGTALADTLKLPASLESIEREAFYGDTSLDEVVVPYGTEYIKARAFAHSSIRKIYIPETVSFIASNAFDGADDVEIHAPTGSYAEAFAEEYDYLWEDSKMVYRIDEMSDIQDIIYDIVNDRLDEPLSLMPMDGQGMLMPAEGITDSELLEIITKCNTLAEAAESEDEAFIETVYNLLDTSYDLLDAIDVYSLDFTGQGISLTGEGVDYSFDEYQSEDLGQNYDIKSISSSADGTSIFAEIQSNGKLYSIRGGTSGITITNGGIVAANSNNTALSSRSYSTNDGAQTGNRGVWEAFVNTINEKLITLQPQIMQLSKLTEKSYNHAENMVRLLSERLEKIDNKLFWSKYYDAGYKQRWARAKEATEAALRNAKKSLGWLTKLKNLIKKANVASAIASIGLSFNRMKQLWAIHDHGHPLDFELSDAERVSLIREMNDNIRNAIIAYGVDIGNTMLDCVQGISLIIAFISSMTGYGVPMGIMEFLTVRVTTTAARYMIHRFIASLIVGTIAEKAFEDVKATDKKLHSIVSGIVRDEESGLPIKNVTVTCKGIQARTNSSGVYTLSAFAGTQTLQFSKKGYNDVSVSLFIEEGTTTYKSITMDSRITLTGTAVDATNAQPISGVTVVYGNYRTTTDANGKYSFTLKPGTATITFSKNGYITWTDTLTTELNKENVCNAFMSKKLDSQWYRVVLSWGAAPRDLDAHLMRTGSNSYHVYYASKTAENASLDHDNIQSESYGHFETITFLADPTQNYSYYVHDYTNRDNTSSNALARSGATVRVYCEDKMVGTYYVPNKSGVIWDVFSIYQGEFRLMTS